MCVYFDVRYISIIDTFLHSVNRNNRKSMTFTHYIVAILICMYVLGFYLTVNNSLTIIHECNAFRRIAKRSTQARYLTCDKPHVTWRGVFIVYPFNRVPAKAQHTTYTVAVYAY